MSNWLKVNLTLLAGLFAFGAIRWFVVGREGRREWKESIQRAGTGRTIGGFLSACIIVLTSGASIETELGYWAQLAAVGAVVVCAGVGMIVGGGIARRRYPDHYEAYSRSEELPPALARDITMLKAKATGVAALPAFVVAIFVYTVWG